MAILALTMGPHLGIIMVPTVHSVGAAGTITFKAVGANGNVRWKLISSNLPAEWDDALNVSGGQATLETDEIEVPGTFSVTVQCTDESRVPVVRTFVVRTMALPLTISGAFPDWVVGQPATGSLTINGGVPPYSGLSITSGALPSGVSLSIVGNQIVPSGSPTTFEEWSATVGVADSNATPASIAVGGAVARLWTPSDLSVAPKIWIDHTTPVTNAVGYASMCENAGSAGGAFEQATPGRRPQILGTGLNGHRVLRFDGIDDNLLGSSNELRSVFSSVSYGWLFAVVRRQAVSSKVSCILQSRTAASIAGRFSCYSGSTAAGYNNSASFVVRRVDGDASGVLRSPDDYSTSWAMLRFAQNWGSGDGVIYTDGAYSIGGATTSAGDTSSSLSDTAVYIGSEGTTTYADNEIACIIVGSGAIPTTDEYQRIEGYYAHAYALQSNLPNDHPYRYSPPVVSP